MTKKRLRFRLFHGSRRTWASAALSLALVAPFAAAAAPDPSCDPMSQAITKMLRTPNHQYMSQNSANEGLMNGGKLRTSESISTEDTSYVKIQDQWRKVPFSRQDMLKQEEESHQNSKETCQFLRDDSSEGDPASVYGAHSEAEGGKSDVQIWISKASGLPLREEIDLDLGSEARKSHSSVRFDYAHVEAPKDAK